MGKKTGSKSNRKKTAAPLQQKGSSKTIPRLKATIDLGRIFSDGRDGAETKDFAALIEQETSPAMLRKALKEKRLPRPKPSLASILRNAPPPQAELDLHGCTAAEAETKTASFIERSRRNFLQTIRVITGKGLHSENGPVLKDTIEALLIGCKESRQIHGYVWGKKDKDKSGAILVYLT